MPAIVAIASAMLAIQVVSFAPQSVPPRIVQTIIGGDVVDRGDRSLSSAITISDRLMNHRLLGTHRPSSMRCVSLGGLFLLRILFLLLGIAGVLSILGQLVILLL